MRLAAHQRAPPMLLIKAAISATDAPRAYARVTASTCPRDQREARPSLIGRGNKPREGLHNLGRAGAM